VPSERNRIGLGAPLDLHRRRNYTPRKWEEIVARRIVYNLIPAAVMLFAGGAALGQGMKTFKPSKRRSGTAQPTP
jgi:hypothetical protein